MFYRTFKCTGCPIDKTETTNQEIECKRSTEVFVQYTDITARVCPSSVIRPNVVYGCETWVLEESVIQRLYVVEREILRKIFGPTEEDNGIWRIKTNKELDELIKHWNIINYVKA